MGKQLKVENQVMRRLGVDRAGTSLAELKKEKDLLNSLRTEVVEHARRDSKKSLTQDDIEFS